MSTGIESPSKAVAHRFVIEAPAGRGGMGTIYRARDLQTGHLVALKLLHGKGIQPQDLERFGREAQILSELSHPNIVAYVAHGRPGEDTAYLAMEWLEGEDLDERLGRGQLTLSESLLILQKTAEALSVAHGQGIVHRDLKPSNFAQDGVRA